MLLSEITLANLRDAHMADGVPMSRPRTPFRNIRDALALHAKVSSSKPFMIAYSAEGKRTELSFVEFVARAHQIANLLYDDLGIQRGDRVATLAHNAPEVALIAMACWIVGAVVVPLNSADDEARLAHILSDSQSKLLFALAPYLDCAERIIATTHVMGVIQVGGEQRPKMLDFHAIVAMRSTTFLGDDSGAKSGDISIRAGNERTAHLDDPALIVYNDDPTAPRAVVLSQYNLLSGAQALAHWHAITGNQRVMGVLPIHDVNGIVATLMTPLIVGGSVVLNQVFDVSYFWERVARERVQIVALEPAQLQALLDYARTSIQSGATMFGHGIHRLDLAHFRHFISSGTLSVALAHAFEDVLGYPIIYGAGWSETSGAACALPITLAWDEHLHWLRDFDTPSIGCALDVNEVAILTSDGTARRLGAGERGELCVRGHNVMLGYAQPDAASDAVFAAGWFHSGYEGYYQLDDQQRPFFFLTGQQVSTE